MLPESPDLDDALPTDSGSALEHVRNAWLHLKVVDHVDVWREGAYAWDPSEYAPIPLETDGETTVVFART